MRNPPEQFAQLKILQWIGPLMAGATVFGVLKLHGFGSGDTLLWLTGAVMVLTWVLSLLSVWGSAWGSRHHLTAVAVEFLFLIAPWSTLLLPYFSKTGPLPGGRLSGLVLLFLLCSLLLSAWYNARRCPMPEGNEHKLKWPNCTIDLSKQTFTVSSEARPNNQQPVLAIGGGVASVGVYHWLSSQTTEQQMVVIGSLISLGICLWLCLVPMGRTLGQVWRVRQLEAMRGVRLTSARLPWLTKERQRFAFGRWWARTFG